ncbi:MAG: phosphatase domain-containing protein [Armatimonadota bacterium]
MKHALTYLPAAVILTAIALYFGGFAYILLWPALACLLVGLAYAGFGACVFGKRADGSLPLWSWVALLPYLAFTWSIWKLKRKISKEPFYNEVAPGLWVGRRVLGGELPEGVLVLVDVTCEFAEPSSALGRCEYRSLPTLNYSVPERGALVALVEELANRDGVYIHCAQGHGRSATLVAALLMRRGTARTPAEAVGMVTAVRPKVHLEPCQQEFLNRLADQSRQE